MSWISDVREELQALDLSRKKLFYFGLLMTAVMSLLATWIFFKRDAILAVYILLVLSLLFLATTLSKPGLIKPIYRIWMTFAFALGWFVSRLILVIIFFLILTPISLLAKISGKRWMDLKFEEKKETYWIPKENKTINYEKLY